MKRINDIVVLLAACLLAFCVGRCSHQCGQPRLGLHPVEWSEPRLDTVRIEVPVPVEVERPVPMDVDTAAILADYFRERHYNDTVIERPNLRVELSDVVTGNQLADRIVRVDYREPMIYRNALSLGADVGRCNLILSAGYRHKTWTVRGGYDFYNKAFMVGLSKDLWRW